MLVFCSAGVGSAVTFECVNLLEFPSLSSAFRVIFMYLLPDFLVHHPIVEARLWAAIAAGAVLVTFRWPMKSVCACEGEGETVAHPWEDVCVVNGGGAGLPHPYFVYQAARGPPS